jgi:hypothetical protein
MARMPNEEEKNIIRLYKEAQAKQPGIKRRKTIINADLINEVLPGLGLVNEKETQTEIYRHQSIDNQKAPEKNQVERRVEVSTQQLTRDSS